MHDHRMILRTSRTSPYGRKVRIAARILGLDDRLAIVHADTLDPEDTLRRDNPLGKMPVLIIDDATRLFDSRVIIEYLQHSASSPHLIPTSGLARYRTLTAAVLAEGVLDAALLMVYEHRFREPEQVSAHWLAHQNDKIGRALGVIADNDSDYAAADIASITLACALGYLDWRRPYDWRTHHPALVNWLDRFAERVPAYERTAASAS